MSEQARGPRRLRRLVAPVAAGALALTGVGLLGAGALSDDGTPPAPGAAQAPTSSAPDPAPSGSAGSGGAGPPARTADGRQRREQDVLAESLPRSAPERVRIPRLDVSSSLVRLGLDGEGVMETPDDPARAGWFTGGPVPGTLGPAVIAGHVTWNQEPAVFYRLGDLRRGDRVTVDRADGSTAVFRVTGVEQYPKDAFPTDDVYGAVDHAALRLVTCGGTYDEEQHRYLDNVVAYAELVPGAGG
jgi:LPXTG-site transpeptidase (sortase) family protein